MRIRSLFLLFLLLASGLDASAQRTGFFFSTAGTDTRTFIIPSDFSSDFTATISASGSEYETDYDFDALKNSITGNTAYIDPTAPGGGDGSQLTPFNSLPTAVANTNFTIYLLKVGPRHIVTADMAINRTMRFGAYGGEGYAEVASQITTNSWVVNGTHSNVYQHANALTSLTVGSVFDESMLDANGLYTGLTKVANLAAVAATAGTFFYDATADIVYVRTHDDRDLSADASGITCLVSSSTTRLFRFNANMGDLQNRKIYMENIRVYGANPVVITNTSTANYWEFGFNNCHFSYAGQKDGILIGGYARGFLKDCRADYNQGDGFNYSNSVGFAFEFNCSSWFSTISDANNGSTSHLGWHIIRVGGDYQYGGGKPVQDINDTKSLSIGCTSINSRAINPEHKAGFASDSNQSGTTEMWLYECTGPTDANKFWNFDTSTMNVYDGAYGNLLTGTNQQDPGSTLNQMTRAEVFQ